VKCQLGVRQEGSRSGSERRPGAKTGGSGSFRWTSGRDVRIISYEKLRIGATVMAKLTLNADREVIEQAKRLAAERRTSVSALFSRFIRALGDGHEKGRVGKRVSP